MTEREFHKLKSTDLIQLLLTQGKEDSLLQAGLDLKKENIASLKNHNDSLKEKLNERDALTEQLKKDLDLSDARIRQLERELKELQEEKWIEMEDPGSLTEAARRLNEIFEEAQREADRYLYGRRPAKENIRQFKPNRQAQQAAKEEPVPEKMILDFNGGAIYADRKPVPPRQEQESRRSGRKPAADTKTAKLQQPKAASNNIEETTVRKTADTQQPQAEAAALSSRADSALEQNTVQAQRPETDVSVEQDTAAVQQSPTDIAVELNSAQVPQPEPVPAAEDEPHELKVDKLLQAIKGADEELRGQQAQEDQQSHTGDNDTFSDPAAAWAEENAVAASASSQEPQEESQESGKKQRRGLFGGLKKKRDSKKTVSRYGFILPIFARQKS